MSYSCQNLDPVGGAVLAGKSDRAAWPWFTRGRDHPRGERVDGDTGEMPPIGAGDQVDHIDAKRRSDALEVSQAHLRTFVQTLTDPGVVDS